MDPAIDYFSNAYFDIVLIYHCVGPLTFLFNLCGIWVVWTKSEKNLGAYKYHLVFHMFVALVWDLTMCFLVCPRILTPYCGGSTHGLLTTLGVETYYQQLCTFAWLDVVLSTCVQLAWYRANTVMIPGSRFKLEDRGFFLAMSVVYLLPMCSGITAGIVAETQYPGGRAAKDIIKVNPQFLTLHEPTSYNTAFIMDFKRPWSLISGAMLLVKFNFHTALIIIPCVSMSIQISSKLISIRQAENIRHFLTGIMLQIAPTMLCYVIPLAWMLSAIMFNIWIPLNQVFSDVACIGMACQSTACISSAIFLNPGSRNYVNAAWQRIVKRKVVEKAPRIVTITEFGSPHRDTPDLAVHHH